MAMFLTVTGSLAVSTGRSLFSGILRMGFHDRYEQCYRKRTWFAYFEGRFIPRKEERRFVRELGQQLSSFGTRNPFQKPEVGRMRRASVLCCALQRAFTQGTTERAVSTAWRGSSEASTSGASYALKQRYGWVQHGSWVWLLSGHGALDYAQCNRFQGLLTILRGMATTSQEGGSQQGPILHMDFRSPLDRVQDVAKQHKVVGMKKDKQPERSRRRREQPKLGIAVMKDLKTSPKKLTVAAKLVKDKHINDAILLAQAHPKKALGFVLDGLKSARANAIHGHGMNPMRIVVKRLVVGKGEYTRRPLQHGRGRMGIMTRYRAHLRVEVGEGDAKPEIQVLLPWLIRSRLERERKAGTGIARAHANAGKPTGADV